MTLTPTITFRNMDTAPEIEEAVLKQTSKLELFFPRITGCRVAVEAPNRQGGLYHVRVDVAVPGETLVVERSATLHTSLRNQQAAGTTKKSEPNRQRRDAQLAVSEVFREMRRRLQDYVRRMRPAVKRSEGLASGKVTSLSPEGESGFIESDSHGVYFHRNSVIGGHFDSLRIGSAVRFAEEPGEKGPQASSVRLVRPARQRRDAAATGVLPPVPKRASK